MCVAASTRIPNAPDDHRSTVGHVSSGQAKVRLARYAVGRIVGTFDEIVTPLV